MRRSSTLWLVAPLAAALVGERRVVRARHRHQRDVGERHRAARSAPLRGCHAAGGVAALPLTDFEQASRLASRVKTEVLARRMPPWHAAPGFGDFANDQSLTAHETQLLVSWADGGTPRGARPDHATAQARTCPTVSTIPDLVLDPGRHTRAVTPPAVCAAHAREDRPVDSWLASSGPETRRW